MKVGFTKPEVRGRGTFTPPPPKQLDSSCGLNDYVCCGEIHGILTQLEGNTATIHLGDGSTRTIELTGSDG